MYAIKKETDVIYQGGEGVLATWMNIVGRNSTKEEHLEYLKKYVLTEIPITGKTITVTQSDTLVLANEAGRVIDSINFRDIFKFSAKTVRELLDEGYVIRVEKEEHNVELYRMSVAGEEIYGAQFLPFYEEADSWTEHLKKEELDDYAKEKNL